MSGSNLSEGFGVVRIFVAEQKLSTTSKKSNSESSKTTTQEPLKGLRFQQAQPRKSEANEAWKQDQPKKSKVNEAWKTSQTHPTSNSNRIGSLQTNMAVFPSNNGKCKYHVTLKHQSYTDKTGCLGYDCYINLSKSMPWAHDFFP